MLPQTEKTDLKGIMYATQAYVAWGILPIYWKFLKDIPATEILTHRILWSLVFIIGYLWFTSGLHFMHLLKNPKTRYAMVVSSILVSGNWGLYIYAVNSGHIIEASLGYYINPLVSIFLGMVVLKERLGLLKKIALAIACIGVVIMTVRFGRFPWMGLTLAFSFAIYSLIKKTTHAGSMESLAAETILTGPIALGFIVFWEINHTGHFFSFGIPSTVMLILAGVATTMPLFWFSQAAKRIPLSSIGFLQYMSPTLSLLLGVFLYGEKFTSDYAVGFIFIWIALIIYTYSLLKPTRYFILAFNFIANREKNKSESKPV